jgi:hypothetical protein
LHGGIIDVRSNGEGEGAEFIIQLPATTLEPKVKAEQITEAIIADSITRHSFIYHLNK